MSELVLELPQASVPAVARVLRVRIERDALDPQLYKRIDLVLEVTAIVPTANGPQPTVLPLQLALTAESFARGSGIIVPGGLASLPTGEGEG